MQMDFSRRLVRYNQIVWQTTELRENEKESQSQSSSSSSSSIREGEREVPYLGTNRFESKAFFKSS